MNLRASQNSDPTVFSKWLADKRLGARVSQNDLAIALDISPFTVLRWEGGQTMPGPENTARLAKFFQTEPWVLEVLAGRPPLWLQQSVLAAPDAIERYCSDLLATA